MTEDDQHRPRDAIRAGALSALLRALAGPGGEGRRPSWVGALRPGAVIGGYELVRQVGRGGFGIVYEARDRGTGRTVAFKAVCASAEPNVREERVLREAELAARLSHPNIVTLCDVGRCEHGPYIVLELLEGETLAARIDRCAIPLGEVLRIARDVAGAMAHAHAVGVVHRDLTPGNVFLCRDGRVKVLDLGMAHAFGRRKIDGGTAAYMAPEQRRGGPEDERTDVFALGVILLEMLAGRASPATNRAGAMPALEVEGAPGLTELLDAMLAPDAVDRPRDAGEVASALAAIAAGHRCDPLAPAAFRVRPSRRGGTGARRRWRVPAGVAIVAALAAGVASWQHARERRGSAASGPVDAATPPSIAVLPFADLSPERDQQYFAEGLAEEILDALAHVPGLRVAGRASSFSWTGGDVDVPQVARQLRVAAVLEGSVRKDGERIRITSQLVRVADGSTLWSERFDRELTGVFAVEDEIARAVVAALRGTLLPADAAAPAPPLPTNVEAYDAYLLGHHYFVRGQHAEALERFEAALRLDPRYAPALAGVAIAALFGQEFDGSAAVAAERPQQAVEAAEQAVAAAPDLADGHTARGLVRAVFVHDWKGALADVQRAIELRRDADTIRAGGILYLALGRYPEAMPLLHEATRLDPLSPAAWNTLGAAQLVEGDLDSAMAALQRSIAISPVQVYAPANIGMVLVLEDRPAEALAVWQRSTSEVIRLMGSAIVNQRLGHRARAQHALHAMISRFGDQGAFRVAQVYGAWGNSGRAIDWLERARQRHSARLALEVKTHPFLQSLRGDRSYRKLLEELNLPPD